MKKLILILICFLFIGCSNENEDINNSIVNNNPDIIKEQQISDLTIKNTFLYYQNGLSTFTIDIVNNSTEVKNYDMTITFKNNNDYILCTLKTTIDEIKPNATKKISINTDIDLSKAIKVEYLLNT